MANKFEVYLACAAKYAMQMGQADLIFAIPNKSKQIPRASLLYFPFSFFLGVYHVCNALLLFSLFRLHVRGTFLGSLFDFHLPADVAAAASAKVKWREKLYSYKWLTIRSMERW